MTYNLTKKDKDFARWLIEQAYSDDPVEPYEQVSCAPLDMFGRPQTLLVSFDGKKEQLNYDQGLDVVNSLAQHRLLIPISTKPVIYKITQDLFDLVDSNFEEVVPKREAQPGVTAKELKALRKAVTEHFNMAELERLCRDVNVDFEDIPGGNVKSNKVDGLVQYMAQHGHLLNLVAHVALARPNLDWAELLP